MTQIVSQSMTKHKLQFLAQDVDLFILEEKIVKLFTWINNNNLKIIKVKLLFIPGFDKVEVVPLLNMISAAPLSVVLSLLSQRKEGKRGRSVSHV